MAMLDDFNRLKPESYYKHELLNFYLQNKRHIGDYVEILKGIDVLLYEKETESSKRIENKLLLDLAFVDDWFPLSRKGKKALEKAFHYQSVPVERVEKIVTELWHGLEVLCGKMN